jgi:hypothetical protein
MTSSSNWQRYLPLALLALLLASGCASRPVSCPPHNPPAELNPACLPTAAQVEACYQDVLRVSLAGSPATLGPACRLLETQAQCSRSTAQPPGTGP